MKALDFYKKRLKDMGFSEKQIKDLTNYKELPDAKDSLIRVKAIEYAKLKYKDKYNDPIYNQEILKVLNAFEVGYEYCKNETEEFSKNNCTLSMQTCGQGSGCKYPHCHI